jgi:colanic acid/amylovoran biosynthesis glycosyltransferase
MKIAIISTNRNKYSETFIQSQITSMPPKVLVYSDGYLPVSVSFDRGKSFKRLRKKWQLKRQSNEEVLKRSFLKERITHVLAQYGQSGVEVMQICKELDLPLVVHFHGFDAYRKDAIDSYGKRYSELFEIAAKVIAVSADMKRQLIDLGCPENKIAQVNYGVNTDLFCPPKKRIEEPIIAFCGRFVEKKDPLGVIRSFTQLKQSLSELQMIMIGDGHLHTLAQELANELNVSDSIIFKGVLSPEEVAKTLRESFMYVQNSTLTDENDSEGTPLSMLEAMSSGLPVVASIHGGIPDVVEHKVNGMLYNSGDSVEMIEHIRFLLNNIEEAHEMGGNARQKVLQEYTIEKYISNISSIIKSS